jgi:DNA-binding protein YbaB
MSKIEFSVKEAYSNAKQKAEEFCESEMNKATGGMPLPFDMKSFL